MVNIKTRTLVLYIVGALILGVIISMGAVGILHSQGVGSVKIPQKEYRHLIYMDKKYGKTEEIWKEISESFYKEVSDEKLSDAINKALMSALDDTYSNYMTKEEFEQWEASTLGEFEGIGISFVQDEDGSFSIVKVHKNGPADQEGLQEGDIITKVDGENFEDADMIGAAMRGKAGTKVDITYERGGKETTVSLERAKITYESINSQILDDNIGYVHISAFEEATAKDFKKVLEDMEKSQVKGMIIDLRNNGGGLVGPGAEIADMLVGKGTVTYLENRKGEKEYIYSSKDRTSIPYVVLVNENTASTSEILTAAVKDNGPGKIVGMNTFGKGVVQATTKLKDGSAIKLTVFQYFSPNGNEIHGKGVSPDYEVDGEAEQLEKAIELLK